MDSARGTADSSEISRKLLFNDYRNRNLFCDIIFKVKDRSFAAHRVFLATQSVYFEGLLTSPMLEATQKEIEMEDILPETFSDVINHMYGNKVDLDMRKLQGIMLAADRFCVDSLLKECKELFQRKWVEMEPIEVAFLAEHFRFEAIQNKIKKALHFFRGSGEITSCLDVGKDFVIMAIDQQELIHPGLALQALGRWLSHDPSRLSALRELFDLYPLEEIPAQTVKRFIENPLIELSTLRDELKELYNTHSRKFTCSNVQIFEVRRNDSAYNIHRFDLKAFGWIPVQSTVGSVKQIIPFTEGFCVLTTNKVYVHYTSEERTIEEFDLRDYSEMSCCMREGKLVLVCSKWDSTGIWEMHLTNPKKISSTKVFVPEVHQPGVILVKDTLYLIGGKHAFEGKGGSNKIDCQACHSYNFVTGVLRHIAYLYVPILHPVLCKYQGFLIILGTEPDKSGILFLHYLDLTSHRIDCCKLEIKHCAKNKELSSWTDVELVSAGANEHEKDMLVFVFSVKAYHKPSEIMICSSTVKAKEHGLEFSPVKPETFLANYDGHSASFAYVL